MRRGLWVATFALGLSPAVATAPGAGSGFVRMSEAPGVVAAVRIAIATGIV